MDLSGSIFTVTRRAASNSSSFSPDYRPDKGTLSILRSEHWHALIDRPHISGLVSRFSRFHTVSENSQWQWTRILAALSCFLSPCRNLVETKVYNLFLSLERFLSLRLLTTVWVIMFNYFLTKSNYLLVSNLSLTSWKVIVLIRYWDILVDVRKL